MKRLLCSFSLGLWCKENFLVVSANAVREYSRNKVAMSSVLPVWPFI